MSNELTIPRESKEYIEVPMVTSSDPTDQTVEFAFPTLGSRPTTWVAGSWLNARAIGAGRSWDAVAVSPLVGATGGSAGTVTLSAGTYTVYLRITSLPEVPVVNCGQVRIA